MKKYLLGVALFLAIACNIGNATERQMTLTTQAGGKVSLFVAGSGTVTIDWGDGSASKTYRLRETNKNRRLKHQYSVTSERKITITGENVLSLRCNGMQLTSIDVSNNTALQMLYVGNNRLTKLDVSKNTVLIALCCGYNQLTSLDVSNNTRLMNLFLERNQLSSEAIDALFETLHDNPRVVHREMNIKDNPG